MANSLTPEQLEPVRQASLAGNKIEAVKLYRVAAGVGLYEAKSEVEKLEAQWRAATPGQFQKPASAGCFGLVVLGGAGLWGVVSLVLAR